MLRVFLTVLLTLTLAACRPPDVNKTENLVEQADALIAGGKYKKAMELYNDAIEESGKDSSFFAKRASLKLLLKDHQGALTDLNRAIELRSDTGWYFSKRAQALAELGQPEKAIDDANRAMHLDPADPSAIIYRARAYAMLGQYDKAFADAKVAQSRGADIIYTNKVLADCCIHLGKPDDALAFVNKALKLQETDPELCCIKAEAQIMKLDLRSALETALICQQKNPDEVKPYMCLAQVYLLLGENEKAQKSIEIVTNRSLNKGRALATVYYLYTNDYTKALDCASTVAAENPCPESLLTLAEVYTLTGRDAEALKIVDGLEKEHPTVASVPRAKALITIRTGQYDRAIEAATRSINLLTYNPIAYRLRAEAQSLKNNSIAAQNDIERAHQLGWSDSMPQEKVLKTIRTQLAQRKLRTL